MYRGRASALSWRGTATTNKGPAALPRALLEAHAQFARTPTERRKSSRLRVDLRGYVVRNSLELESRGARRALAPRGCIICDSARPGWPAGPTGLSYRGTTNNGVLRWGGPSVGPPSLAQPPCLQRVVSTRPQELRQPASLCDVLHRGGRGRGGACTSSAVLLLSPGTGRSARRQPTHSDTNSEARAGSAHAPLMLILAGCHDVKPVSPTAPRRAAPRNKRDKTGTPENSPRKRDGAGRGGEGSRRITLRPN